MKTLKNNVILYDSNCPLCKAYTGTFVACGLLDRNGRSAYNEKDPGLFRLINEQKARNEIALVDLTKQTVTYGIDSLIRILGHGRPLISGLLNCPLVYYPSKFFYALVSYNRKMIAPSKYKTDECVPDFSWFYRICFLVFTALLTAGILYKFITPVLASAGLYTGITQELAVVSGQIFFQAMVLRLARQKNIMQYLGNMMSISTIGALFLLPAIWLMTQTGFNYLFALAWFAMVVGIMFLLHLKRCKKLDLGLWVSASWVIYRVLVLILIFTLS